MDKKKAKPAVKTAKPVEKKPEKLSPAAMEALKNYEDAKMLEQMGKRYDEIMPSPEPGESKPKGHAKGGVMKKYAMGGVGVPPSQMQQQRMPMPQQRPVMAKGGAVKKGYAKGGMAMCGASMPPAQKGKK